MGRTYKRRTLERNEAGLGLLEVMIAVSILGVIAIGTTQMMTNLSKENRAMRQANQAEQLQLSLSQLLANTDVCTRNFGSTSPSAFTFDVPPTTTTLNRDLTDKDGSVVYKVDGATQYADRTLVIKSYSITQTAVLQSTTPAVVLGQLRFIFEKTGDTVGSKHLVRSVTLEARLSGAVGSPIDTCSVVGLDDFLWMKVNTTDIYNTNSGNVGIGTNAPTSKLQVGAPPSATGAMSSTIATYASNLGAGAGSDMPVASFGFGPTNTSALGIHGYRVANGSDWTTAAIGLGIDVDNTTRVNGSGLWFHPNGNVGIKKTDPVRTLDIDGSFATTNGNSSLSFADEAGASVARLKTNVNGGVAAMIVGNAAQEFQMRVNSDNSLTLGSYVGAGNLRGFNLRSTATVNGVGYTGTVFEFGEHSGTSPVRLVASPTGAVFQGRGAINTVFGNWDGGNVDLYSNARTVVTAGSGGVRVGSFGGEVELLASGAIRLNSATGQIIGSGPYSQSSDVRLKKNITPLEDPLDKVLQLRGVEYDWKDSDRAKSGHQIGLIAQEVEDVYPEVVVTNKETGMKAVAYDHLVAPLIEAVKELSRRIASVSDSTDSLQSELEQTQSEVARLKAENEALNDRLDRLERIIDDGQKSK